MAIDPICGMQANEKTAPSATRDGVMYYFCSAHCRKKFMADTGATCAADASCCHPGTGRWYTHKTVLVAALLVVVLWLSTIVPILVPFRESFLMYFQRVWLAIALGLLLGGAVNHFIPHELVSHVLARPKKRTIFYSVILGFFMSACNHGILALSVQLYKKGASASSVVAFLLASPWANLPLTIMLIGFFGVARALYIIAGAIVIALVTGFVYQFFESRKMIETNPHTRFSERPVEIIPLLRRGFSAHRWNTETIKRDIAGVWGGAVLLGDMVLWWLLIGMTLASVAGAYIPADIFRQYMGPTALGLCVTLVIATVLEVCSEGTAPLAFEIFRQTGAVGNSFVFLMAGVATDYTEIGLIWTTIGKRSALWLPVITVPQILVWGIVANMVFK